MTNDIFSEEKINKIKYKEIETNSVYTLITKNNFKLDIIPIITLEKNKYKLKVKDLKDKTKKNFPKKLYGKAWFVKKKLY